MKIFLASIILIMLSSCSFDNKTGIWKNSSDSTVEKEKTFKDFETLYTKTQSFNSVVELFSLSPKLPDWAKFSGETYPYTFDCKLRIYTS